MKTALRHRVASVMRSSPFFGRYRIYQVVAAVLGDEPVPFTVPIQWGYRLKVASEMWQHMFYLGDYERDVVAFLDRSLTGESTAFDLGASMGIVTLPMAHRAKRVFAFDALRANYDLLLENLQQNHIENVVTVYAAVSDGDGVIRIPQTASGNFSLASASESFADVQAVTLDTFCAERGVERIDVMKIDIEGSETKALRGARRMFAERRIGTVLIEFNNYWLRKMGSSPDELYDLFEAYGLTVHELTSTGGTKKISRSECMGKIVEPTSFFNLVLTA